MHIPVDSGARKDRWKISYYGNPPSRRTLKAFRVIGENLWPAIVKTELGGNTYSRCILTSFAITEFLKSKGFAAEVTRALLDVSLRRGTDLAHPRTLGIGEPKPEQEETGIHLICKLVDSDGRIWLLDGSTRQASRPGRWKQPPEVIVAEAFPEPPIVGPEDAFAKHGFTPLAAVGIDQGDGTSLLLQWGTKDELPEDWSAVPDADPSRSAKLRTRLELAWKRT